MTNDESTPTETHDPTDATIAPPVAPTPTPASASPTVDQTGLQAKIYQAMSVQRPVVIEFLKALRRERPDASVTEILDLLEKRYVATVTATSTGVGASAAIPAVGVPLALGLGVADLLFFYETSALFVLATTELHGIEVTDDERARPLVFGMLLGQKSQNKVAGLVYQAAGAGGVAHARSIASGTVGKRLPAGWGEVVTGQVPDTALAPLATVLAREAIKGSAKLGAGTLGKIIPFGVGAIVGGAGSFIFGRDVVKAAHIAFATPPTEFPESLRDFQKPDANAAAPPRAVRALTAARRTGKTITDAVAGGVGAVVARFSRRRRHADVPTSAQADDPVKEAGSDPTPESTLGQDATRSPGDPV